MKHDEWRIGIESRELISRRQGKPDRLLDGGSESFGEFQIPLHRVRAPIDFRDAMIKQPRTFPAIAHSPKLSRSAYFTDQGASQQSLEIERHVRTHGPRLFQPRHEAPRGVQASQL